MAQGIQPGAVGAALRLGVIGGLLSGVLSLADPIVGGTLARAGTGFADSSAGSIVHNLQLALLIAGMVVTIQVGVVWAGRVGA
jgi:hypothetical protein